MYYRGLYFGRRHNVEFGLQLLERVVQIPGLQQDEIALKLALLHLIKSLPRAVICPRAAMKHLKRIQLLLVSLIGDRVDLAPHHAFDDLYSGKHLWLERPWSPSGPTPLWEILLANTHHYMLGKLSSDPISISGGRGIFHRSRTLLPRMESVLNRAVQCWLEVLKDRNINIPNYLKEEDSAYQRMPYRARTNVFWQRCYQGSTVFLAPGRIPYEVRLHFFHDSPSPTSLAVILKETTVESVQQEVDELLEANTVKMPGAWVE